MFQFSSFFLQIPVNDSSHWFALDLCLYIEDATNVRLVWYVYLCSALKKNSFGFCSCSQLMQLKLFEEEKMLTDSYAVYGKIL